MKQLIVGLLLALAVHRRSKWLRYYFRSAFFLPLLTSAASISIVLTYHIDECGFSVAVAWLTLTLGGRWRPEPSWIDRMGRVLGFYFIAIIPLAILIPYLR